MLYTPLLPGAAGGTLEPRHVVVPLREALRRTDLRVGSVTGADPDRNIVTVESIAGRAEEIGYDHLIVAVGSISRTLPVPGLAEHGIGFKSLPDAIELRNRLLRTLEAAETLDDPAEREALLTYVFVGAGYAGLEGLAELQDFAAAAIARYPRCRTQGMRWMLVEATDRVMPEVSPTLAEFASRELRGARHRDPHRDDARGADADDRALSDGEVVQTRTCVWTAGVRPHPVVERLGLPLDDTGRIAVDKTMRVNGRANVWAIGDAAAVPDPAKKRERAVPADRPPRCARAGAWGATSPRRSARAASARSATGRSACSSTWARGRRWRRRWACAGADASPGCSPARSTSP